MSLKNIDIESAMRRVADQRIEEAMREGKFDNLQGKGEPIDLESAPADEYARMMWWALRILKNNDYTPDEVRWRKTIDGLKSELATSQSEPRVRALVVTINELVRKVNTLGTNARQAGVSPVSLESELHRLQDRIAG